MEIGQRIKKLEGDLLKLSQLTEGCEYKYNNN